MPKTTHRFLAPPRVPVMNQESCPCSMCCPCLLEARCRMPEGRLFGAQKPFTGNSDQLECGMWSPSPAKRRCSRWPAVDISVLRANAQQGCGSGSGALPRLLQNQAYPMFAWRRPAIHLRRSALKKQFRTFGILPVQYCHADLRDTTTGEADRCAW